MTTTGAIAANFHEGARSEYLAHYAFSAFGTSIPVPRPEDSGVDLYCTLGHRIGQRLHVDNYYLVQVKSDESDIVFENAKSVEWLLSLISPLLLACIDKKTSNIRVFATLGVSMLYAKKGIDKVVLIPEPFPDEFAKELFSPLPVAFDKNEPNTANVYLGQPILDFGVSSLQDSQFVSGACEVLKSWLQIDQININHKSMGHTFFQLPVNGVANRIAPIVQQIVGNFLDSENSSEISLRHAESYFKCLTQQLHIAANSSQKKRWVATYSAAIVALQQYKNIRSGAAFNSMLGGLCEGALRFGRPVDAFLKPYLTQYEKLHNLKFV